MEILLSVRARQARGDTDTQTHRHTDTQTHRHTGMQQAYRHTDTQAYRHTDTQRYRHTDTQAYRHTAPASSVACFGCRVYDLFLVSDGGITAEGTGLRHLSRQICRT